MTPLLRYWKDIVYAREHFLEMIHLITDYLNVMVTFSVFCISHIEVIKIIITQKEQ